MCFSERLSVLAFLVGASGTVATSIRAERERTQRPVAAQQRVVFAATSVAVVLVQLYEALMWRLIRLRRPPALTIQWLLLATVLSQPLILGAGTAAVAFRNPDAWPAWQAWTVVSLSAVYLAAVGFTLGRKLTSVRPAVPNDCGTGGCRLNWNWASGMEPAWAMYFVVISTCVAFVKPASSAAYLGAAVAASILAALLLFARPFGSRWCFVGVLLPWVVFALPL